MENNYHNIQNDDASRATNSLDQFFDKMMKKSFAKFSEDLKLSDDANKAKELESDISSGPKKDRSVDVETNPLSSLSSNYKPNPKLASNANSKSLNAIPAHNEKLNDDGSDDYLLDMFYQNSSTNSDPQKDNSIDSTNHSNGK